MRDPDALARWIGNGGLALGAVCAAGVIGLLVKPDEAVIRVVGFAGLIVVIVSVIRSIGRSDAVLQFSTRFETS